MKKRRTIQTSIHVPDELRKRLRIRAIEEGVSVSRIIERLVGEYLAKPSKGGAK